MDTELLKQIHAVLGDLNDDMTQIEDDLRCEWPPSDWSCDELIEYRQRRDKAKAIENQLHAMLYGKGVAQ